MGYKPVHVAVTVAVCAWLFGTRSEWLMGDNVRGKNKEARSVVAAPPIIPVQPKAYPSADETLFIAGSYLNDSIVTSALAYVNSVVDPTVLAYKTSKYISFSTVTYNDNPTTTCYWPYASPHCTRTTAGKWGNPDIVYCPSSYQWGLTYDDAPSVNLVGSTHVNDTYSIMDQLTKMNLKATFFVTGSQATYYPTALVAVANAGHHVAHHSWTHHPFTSLTNVQIVAELMYTQAIVYKLTGLSMRFFRPPYGDIDDRVRAIVNALGFRIVLWDPTYDSFDSDVTANAAGYQTVITRMTSWFNTPTPFIALQHTINTFSSGTAVAALKKIQAMGGIQNQLMTVPQCLGDTQWYKNTQVTTIYNSCTIPGGCDGKPPVSPTVPASAKASAAASGKASGKASAAASAKVSAAAASPSSTSTGGCGAGVGSCSAANAPW
ncbi:hypothetical protein SmJEL517_g04896 [Synchytrium microbalum]|uniref:NodB homology domain-containing protein n=1 Tax=Synchytrium microbalum TaxID=1806994 RepID=A0A507C2U7_9FUNG|nr:uncharacterized protein SmJEL517_g04896 [Synchytrium microbalum]TPX31833.1 hypothetical protein SmJEL517_g04896 [Synchytrium microbalum]